MISYIRLNEKEKGLEMDALLQADIWLSLLTLTLLEVILGIDNLVFITITTNNLPKQQQRRGRRIGLLFAVITRLMLLGSLFWLAGLTTPLFSISHYQFSARDLILILGGLFLLIKGTREIHNGFFRPSVEELLDPLGGRSKTFWLVILQIMILDIIFSLDSVITAVGMTRHFPVMATAIIIAVIAMMFASDYLSKLINQYASLKMLALSFLLLVGMVLIADGFHVEIPRGYVYFAMLFSLTVEALSIAANKSAQKKGGNK